MKLEDILAKQIGDLTVANARLGLMLELAKQELAKRDEIIKKLNDAEPELPIAPARDHLKEHRNGAN